MAFFSGENRATPLIGREMSAAMNKRLMEFTGLGVGAVAVVLAICLFSYNAADPSFFSATPDAPANWLGYPGAMLADALMRALGAAGWIAVLFLLVWAFRLVRHVGENRLARRAMVFPVALVLGAAFLSTHSPWEGWQLSSGLGGFVGDTIIVALLNILPMPATTALRLLSALSGLGMAVSVAYAVGLTVAEAIGLWRWMFFSMLAAGKTGVQSGVQVARDGVARARTPSEAPRSERLPPAEPTGSWKQRMLDRVKPGGRAPDADDDEEEAIPLAAPAASPSLAATAPETPAAGSAHWRDRMLGRVRAQEEPPVETPVQPPAPAEAPKPAASGSHWRDRMLGRIRSHEEPPPGREGSVHLLRDEAPEAPGAGGGAFEINSAIRALTGLSEELGEAEPTDSRKGLRLAAVNPPPEPGAPLARQRRAEPPLTADGRYDDEDDELPLGAPQADDPADDILRQLAPKLDRARAPRARPEPEPEFEPEPEAELEDLAPPPSPVERKPQRPAKLSRRATREREPMLFESMNDAADYDAPPLGLLEKAVPVIRAQTSANALHENARMLETVLEDYGVRGEIVAVKPGPVVTLYELEPAPGLKASRIIGLADDIARSMSALSARVSTVPGRSVIGIELPNAEREKVLLRELLESPAYGDSQVKLALALGKDISGQPIVTNLAKMPHLLIAGTTGSGKSVAINTMILSLLYRLSPEQCRVIMIDPKMLELSVYDGIPHLLAPVVTDPKKAVVALKWVVAEMEERYRKMSKVGVRNIDGYNARVREAIDKGEAFSRVVQTGFDDTTGEPVYETETMEPEELPFIVVIVDEMADLMMVAGKEIEACIQRLAQMARASGIHLIMATQRPSVDVITGTIKANFPTRISFQVTSKIDSRTILGEQGAEQLLGMGDMLYMAGGGRITRVHGPFVSDEEVEAVVGHLKTLGRPEYVGAVTEGADEETQALIEEKLGLATGQDDDASLYDKAVAVVARDRKCSTSYIQRKLAIGYNKAARLVEEMEAQGVVSPANAVGKRDILIEER